MAKRRIRPCSLCGLPSLKTICARAKCRREAGLCIDCGSKNIFGNARCRTHCMARRGEESVYRERWKTQRKLAQAAKRVLEREQENAAIQERRLSLGLPLSNAPAPKVPVNKDVPAAIRRKMDREVES